MSPVLGLRVGAGGVDLERERGGGRDHLWRDGGGGGTHWGEWGRSGAHEAHGADRAWQLVITVKEVDLKWFVRWTGFSEYAEERGFGHRYKEDATRKKQGDRGGE